MEIFGRQIQVYLNGYIEDQRPVYFEHKYAVGRSKKSFGRDINVITHNIIHLIYIEEM